VTGRRRRRPPLLCSQRSGRPRVRGPAGRQQCAGEGDDQPGQRERREFPGAVYAGMRERAVLLGGALTAGPVRAGGFSVSAVLPFTDTS
jgi:hypothetical protein